MKGIMNRIGLATLWQASIVGASVEYVQEFLIGIIADSHGDQRYVTVNETVYDTETGLHKGTGVGCFWTD